MQHFYVLGRKSIEWSSTANPLNLRTPRKAKLLVSSLLLFHHTSEIHQDNIQRYLWTQVGNSSARTTRFSRAIGDLKKMFGDNFVKVRGKRENRIISIEHPDLIQFDVFELQDLLKYPIPNHQQILKLYRGPLLIDKDQREPIWGKIRQLRLDLHSNICTLLTDLIRFRDNSNEIEHINQYIQFIDQMERLDEDQVVSKERLSEYLRDKIVLNILQSNFSSARHILYQSEIILKQHAPNWLGKFNTFFDDQIFSREIWLEWLNVRSMRNLFQAPSLPVVVNREQIFEDIRSHLLSPNSANIVSLEGMAGIGKTTIASKVAHALYFETKYFHHGVLWGSLESSDLRTVIIAWADGLGKDLSIITGENCLVLFRHLLEHKQVLIILDNVDIWAHDKSFDQLITDLTRLFPRFSRSKLVITTRSRDIADHLGMNTVRFSVNELPRSAGIELVKQLSATFSEATEQLAHEVGYHPLALELISIQLKRSYVTPEEMLILIQKSPQNILNRIHTVLNKLWKRLPTATQFSFPKFAVFGSNIFDIEHGIQHIQSGMSRHDSIVAKQILSNLVALFLIQEIGNGSLRLHPIISKFAKEKFEQWSDEQQIPVILQYSHIYMNQIQTFQDNQVTLSQIIDIWGHVTNSLSLAEQHNLVDLVIDWMQMIQPIWFLLGKYDEALVYLERYLTHPQVQKHKESIGWFNLHIGRIYLERSLYHRATEHLSTSLQHYYDAENSEGIADALHYQGRLELEIETIQKGNMTELAVPEQHLRESIRIREEYTKPTTTQQLSKLQTEYLLVEIPYHDGQFELVISQAKQSLDQLEDLPASATRDMLKVRFYGVLGDVEWARKDFQSALPYLNQGIELSELVGELTVRPVLLISRSVAHRNLEDFELAIQDASQSIDILNSLQDHDMLRRAYRTRSKAYIMYEQYDYALEDVTNAIEQAMIVGASRITALYIERANLYRRLNRTDDACAEAELIYSSLEEPKAVSMNRLHPYTRSMFEDILDECRRL